MGSRPWIFFLLTHALPYMNDRHLEEQGSLNWLVSQAMYLHAIILLRGVSKECAFPFHYGVGFRKIYGI